MSGYIPVAIGLSTHPARKVYISLPLHRQFDLALSVQMTVECAMPAQDDPGKQGARKPTHPGESFCNSLRFGGFPHNR